MGYNTTFDGRFDIDRILDKDTYLFLYKLNLTRRIARAMSSDYGIEGELYVDGEGPEALKVPNLVIDRNRPPKTQPSLWCQWRPSVDRMHLEWDHGEKFYGYVEWLKYLIIKILSPKGYALSGSVSWQGEEEGDSGVINVVNNHVYTKLGAEAPEYVKKEVEKKYQAPEGLTLFPRRKVVWK